MKRGYLRFLRESASIIGAKSVPALANTYSTPRSARRARKASAVMAFPLSTALTHWVGGVRPRVKVARAIAQSAQGVETSAPLPKFVSHAATSDANFGSKGAPGRELIDAQP